MRELFIFSEGCVLLIKNKYFPNYRNIKLPYNLKFLWQHDIFLYFLNAFSHISLSL
jgi:hypothetical protein